MGGRVKGENQFVVWDLPEDVKFEDEDEDDKSDDIRV